jgi:MFS family permease
MFALSPISGRLTDRFGSPLVIAAGLAILALSAVLAAVAPPDGGAILFLALFLLGYGWNLGYVAGSAMLAGGLARSERTRLQGITDSFIWSSAAAASLTSGVVVSWAGYATLGLLGAGLVAIPAIILFGARRPTAPAPT